MFYQQVYIDFITNYCFVTSLLDIKQSNIKGIDERFVFGIK